MIEENAEEAPLASDMARRREGSWGGKPTPLETKARWVVWGARGPTAPA
jgi:hypothetical protein